MTQVLEDLYERVVQGKKSEAEALVSQALGAGIPAEAILNDGLIKAMQEVGARFERAEFYVPEMLVAARAMQSGLAVLRPHLVAQGIPAAGKVVMGTVKGDLHDIGKNLVAMMLEGAGYEIIDLGTDVAPEKFAHAVREHGADFIGMSALLTTTMQNMKSVVEAIEDLGLRQKVRILVGGAPVTDHFAKDIGADGYAPDASRAVALAKSLS